MDYDSQRESQAAGRNIEDVACRGRPKGGPLVGIPFTGGPLVGIPFTGGPLVGIPQKKVLSHDDKPFKVVSG